MELDVATQTIQVLVGIAALGTAGYRLVVIPIKRGLERLDNRMVAIERNREDIQGVKAELSTIAEELTENGGSSLKDAVERVEAGTQEIKGRLDAHIDFHLQEGRDRR